eukprot:gi/632987013/ref/XP_007910559.1/ PREDICTED: SITS-binding protein-like [Callorhinchus milii]
MARDLCASNRSRFCSHWEGAELHISSHLRSAANTDCYRVAWTPRHCRARIQDCFSMVNVSWFGGASLRSQHWPINRASASSQPFLISDLQEQPSGFGSVLEGYFLGSTGVAVLLDGDLPLHLLIEREKRFCLEPRPDVALSALRYTVCVSHNIRSVHQDVGSLLARAPATAPHTALLGRPVWRWPPATDSTDELKRDLRSFINKLKKHKMPEGVLELSESATLRSAQELSRQWRRRKGTLLWQGLGVAITVSLYSSIDSAQFLSSLREGLEGLWLSVCSPAPGTAAPVLMKRKGKLVVKLNVSNPAAVSWYLGTVRSLQRRLGAAYTVLEGGRAVATAQEPSTAPTALPTAQHSAPLPLPLDP